MKNNEWKALFRFSKGERAGLALLMGTALLVLLLPRFYHPATPLLVIDSIAERSLLQTAAATPADTAAPAVVSLFRFDPNTLSAEGWLQLGVPPRTVNTILHYREKGGRFRQAQDLLKLYGLSPASAQRLMPYVTIDTAFTGAAFHYPPRTGYKPPEPVDINTASAAQWEALPGIGPVLAARIVQQRDATGGFATPEAVKQTFGLADSTYQRIQPLLRLQTPASGKTNINLANLAQLKANTHIPPDAAAAIVIYRQQHGPYQTINDLRKIVFISDALFREIAPWVTTGQ